MLCFIVQMSIEDEIKMGLEYFGLPIDENRLKELKLYITELQKWNQHINLTGKKDISSIIRELLYDAFFVYKHIDGVSSFLDVGSGSGIVSLPIAIINRNLDVFSVEKNLKKIHFQRHIKRMLRLTKFYPLHGKIEFIDGIYVDIIMFKAFSKTEIIFDNVVRLLKRDGRILILKGKNAEPVQLKGFVISKNLVYSLPDSKKNYRLFEYVLENRL